MDKLEETPMKETVLLVIGAVLGVILAITVQRPIEEWLDAQKDPDRLLSEADANHHRMTEPDLNAALEKYTMVGEKAAELKAQSYWGISRTYTDLATLRRWRGLTRSDYPDKAQSYALKAVSVAPTAVETHIALAYAYECSEADESTKRATRAKVLELMESKADNPDVQYLNWLSKATDEAKLYPDNLRPETISELRILIDGAMYYARQIESDLDDQSRRLRAARANQFLDRAAALYPENPLLLFARGYLAAALGNAVSARQYYERALNAEPEFPKAQHNLGYTYALAGNYQTARTHFESALLTIGAPAESQRLWLQNLGSVSLELDDKEKACNAWKQASEIPAASEDPFTFLGLAYCSYITGRVPEATDQFRKAITLGKAKEWDLQNLETYRHLRAGPKEMMLAKELISLVRR